MAALKKGTYLVRREHWEQFCKDADEGGLRGRHGDLWSERMCHDYWSHPAQDSFIFYYGTGLYCGFGFDIKGCEHGPYKEYIPTPPTNPNQELLDWTVENIEEWDEEWTHIRGCSVLVMFTRGEGWFFSQAGHWGVGSCCPPVLYEILHHKTPDCDKTSQVVTREEWLEAKPKEEEQPVRLTIEQVAEGLEMSDWVSWTPVVNTYLQEVYNYHNPSLLNSDISSLEQQLKEKKKQLEEVTNVK